MNVTLSPRRLSRDREQLIKVAAGRAATRLAISNAQTLAPACEALSALMGPDQPTGVCVCVRFSASCSPAVYFLSACIQHPSCALLEILCLSCPHPHTEVARQALLAVRRLADALRARQKEAGSSEDLLQPHLAALVPPMCAVAAHTSGEMEVIRECRVGLSAAPHILPYPITHIFLSALLFSGPVRGTAERSLCRVLDMDPNSCAPGEAVAKYLAAGPGSTVKSVLTEPFLRRVAKINFDDELFTGEEF